MNTIAVKSFLSEVVAASKAINGPGSNPTVGIKQEVNTNDPVVVFTTRAGEVAFTVDELLECTHYDMVDMIRREIGTRALERNNSGE